MGEVRIISLNTQNISCNQTRYNNATYPATCSEDEKVRLTLKESTQTKIKGQIDASFEQVDTANNRKKEDGTPSAGMQDEKAFRTLRS
jgi:hypothetical protein